MFSKFVACCGNNFLCYEDFAATITMATFGKTGAFARRSNCLIGYRVMSKCCFEFSTAYSTSACVETVCRSTCSMSERRNNFLCYEYFTTYRAVVAFGETGVYTIRCNSLIGYGDVSESRNYFLCYEYFATTITVTTFGKTSVYTGGSNCTIGYRVMSKCGNNFL